MLMLPISDYISDFTSSEQFFFVAAPLKEHSESLLDHFCRNCPEPVGIVTIEAALSAMANLDLPLAIRKEIPVLLVAFFEYLGTSGRFPPATAWIQATEIAGKNYQTRFRGDGSVRGDTFEKKYSDVGRNDPCPCGSGKKFKKCCG